MKFGNAITPALAAFGLFVAAVGAHAAPTYVFGNLPTAGGTFPSDPLSAPRVAATLFANTVDVTMTETFESRPLGPLAGTGNAVAAFTGGTITQAAVPTVGQYIGASIRTGQAPTPSGRFNTTNGAAAGRWLETELSFSVNIGQSVGAFGFFGTDFGDFDGRLEIELFNGNTSVLANAFTNAQGKPLQPRGTGGAQNGSLFFFGYASETLFDRIEFRVGQGQGIGAGDWDYLGFDDLQVGNLRGTIPSVPEPGSLALVGVGLFAAGCVRKARRAFSGG